MEGGKLVPAEALVLVTPTALTARGDNLLLGEEGHERGEKTTSAKAATNTLFFPTSSSSSTPSRFFPVLPSTLLLVAEINSLIISWVMMKESKGAIARYSDLMGPALDGNVVTEVCGLLRGYVERMKGRFLTDGEGGGGVGEGGGVVGGGEGGKELRTTTVSSSSSSSNKKLTLAEMKERVVAAEALEAVRCVTLWELSHTWINDPLVLVDPASAVIKDIKLVQELYAHVIEALNEASGEAATARSTAAAATAAAATSEAPGSPSAP